MRGFAVLATLTVVLVLVVAAAATTGAVTFGPRTFAALIHGRVDDPMVRTFVDLRLPRVIIAAAVGAALAVSGTLLQGLLRNPLVDPYLAGSSAGASCAIALAEVAGLAPELWPAAAFVAALLAALTALALARTGTGLSAERLILAGVAISALCSSVVTLLITLYPASGEGMRVLAWLGGSLSGHGWAELHWTWPYGAAGFGLAFALAPTLNVLRLGEERAEALGVGRHVAPLLIVAAATLLTAVAVSLSGMIGFVGMLVPHVARRMIGGDARRLMPAAMILGAIAVIGADWIARSAVPPQELPLGVILALAGVPAFLYMAFHKRQGRTGFDEL